jgi:hypothetical protein
MKKDSAPKSEKRLTLTKDTLRILTDQDLEQAVGGGNARKGGWINGRRWTA